MHLIWFRILLLYTAYPFLSSLSSPKSLVAFFDGGSKLSRAASGIVLCSVTNTSSILPLSWNESDISVDFGYAFYFGSINSSLAAEYLSVIEALHLIKTSIFDDLNINEVYLLGDSSNVITSLLNQQSKFQDPLISSYSCVAKGILNSISECVPVHLSHIPRARNHVADSLCDICLEMKRPLHAAYRNNSETKYSWVLNDIKLNRMLSYYNKDENKNEKYSKLLVFKINTSTGALTSSTKQLLNDLKLRIVLSTLNITLFYDLLQPSGEIALPFSYSKSKLSDINIQYSLCIGTENRVISEIMNTTITATNTFKTADKQELINESASTVVDVSLIDNPIVGVQIGVSVTDPSDILSLACDTSSNVPSTYTIAECTRLLGRQGSLTNILHKRRNTIVKTSQFTSIPSNSATSTYFNMPDQCRSVLSSILNIDKDALLNQLPLTPLQIALLTGNIEMALHILTLAPHTCGIDLLVSEPESESTLRNEYSLNCLHLAVLSGQISTLSRFLRCVKSFDDHDFTTPAKISTSMTSSITRDIAGTKVTTNFPLGRKLLFGRTSNYEYGYTPLSLAVKCNLPIISRELMRFERFYKIL